MVKNMINTFYAAQMALLKSWSKGKGNSNACRWCKSDKTGDYALIVDGYGTSLINIPKSEFSLSEEWLKKEIGVPCNLDGLMQDIIYNDIEYKLAQKTGYKIVGEKQLAIYDTGEIQAYIDENLYKGVLNTKNPDLRFWVRSDKHPVIVKYYDLIVYVILPIKVKA